jgi:hypothetical protein
MDAPLQRVPFTVIIFGTIFLYTWVLEPRGIPVAAPAAIVVISTLVSNLRSGVWGLSVSAFLPALREAALFTVPAVLVVLAIGLLLGSVHDRGAIMRDLAALVPWGAAQQWVLQTVVLREVQPRAGRRGSVLIAAALFALVHAPNPALMMATFAGALGWCTIFTRHPNYLPLGLSHAIGTLALLYGLGDEAMGQLRIGRAFLRLED